MNATRRSFLYKLLALVTAAGLLAGCSPASKASQPVSPANSATTAPGQSGESAPAEGEEQARFVDRTVEDPIGELPALGSVSFTVDEAHHASGDFTPGGAGLELSITDAAGLTWTLLLPPSALSEPKTITLTALKAVQSADIPGDQKGGVLLEPDGLVLMEAATLVVNGAGLEGKALFLGGKHDGTGMNLALPKKVETGSAAEIRHFSAYTAFQSDDPQINDLRDRAIKHYKELSKKGRELLKDKDLRVPRPPSIPLVCPEDEDDAKDRQEDLKEYAEDFSQPEYKLLSQLMASQKSLELLGVEPDFTLEIRLLERMIAKVNLLIKEYGNQPEKVEAITRVGFMVAHDIALLGQSGSARSIEVIQALGRMCEGVIGKLLKELREEHEYRNVGAILEMSRRAQLVGVGTISADQLIARIEAAMNFDLEVSYDLKISGNQIYEFKGQTPVQVDFQNTNSLVTLHGLGIGELISYRNIREPSITIEAPNFQFEVLFTNFDACKQSAYLTIDRLAPETEVYKINEELMPTLPVAHNCWKATYEKYLQNTSMGQLYSFPVELRNGDPVAVEAEFEETAPKSKGNVVGVFTARLMHKPK